MGLIDQAVADRKALPLLIINPLRVAVCFLLLAVLFIALETYEWLVIMIPSFLSRRYRARHYHRLWNALIFFWGSGITRVVQATTGVRIRVEGAVPAAPHIVVCNHQSTGDITCLIHGLRGMNLKFLAKKQLLRGIPDVSSALRFGGFGIVDFSSPRSTLKGLIEFGRSLPEWNGSPVIFAEGIRTQDGSIGSYKTAGIRTLVRVTGLPVLPVVIDGLWRARTVRQFFFHLPGSEFHIRVLPPIPAEEALERLEELASELERLARDELARMRARQDGPATFAAVEGASGRDGGAAERPGHR